MGYLHLKKIWTNIDNIYILKRLRYFAFNKKRNLVFEMSVGV